MERKKDIKITSKRKSTTKKEKVASNIKTIGKSKKHLLDDIEIQSFFASNVVLGSQNNNDSVGSANRGLLSTIDSFYTKMGFPYEDYFKPLLANTNYYTIGNVGGFFVATLITDSSRNSQSYACMLHSAVWHDINNNGYDYFCMLGNDIPGYLHNYNYPIHDPLNISPTPVNYYPHYTSEVFSFAQYTESAFNGIIRAGFQPATFYDSSIGYGVYFFGAPPVATQPFGIGNPQPASLKPLPFLGPQTPATLPYFFAQDPPSADNEQGIFDECRESGEEEWDEVNEPEEDTANEGDWQPNDKGADRAGADRGNDRGHDRGY